MDLDLVGRRALVTGSSSGLGAGIARMLAAEGARVVVHGRNAVRTEAIAAEIGAAGMALGDLGTDEGADAVARTALEALGGGIDILVNNAGGGTDGSTSRPFLEVTVGEWLATYQINTLAALRMIERLVPAMRQGGFGRILQISSAVSVQPNTQGPDYSSAKAAMNNLSVNLAHALIGTGITVNTVSPGIILTPAMLKWGRTIAAEHGWGEPDDAELERRIALDRARLPVGRIGRDEDVAMVVCLLASPRAGFITGANYRIDGGQVKSTN